MGWPIITTVLISSMSAPHTAHTIGTRQIFETWWPLAGSWMLMGIELPLVSVVMGRLADPEIHLAAYGGIVFPLSLLIEAPIIMMLAASTALSQNWQAYRLLRRFMIQAATCLTGLHILIAFTPLYDILVIDMLGVPSDIIAPGRDGLQLMTPWTAAIALRRFQQGVLIRFGKSRVVASGTAVRLITHISALTTGYMIGTLPGIIVATSAMVAGVIAEAILINRFVQPILRQMPHTALPQHTPLTIKTLTQFYAPLALTPMLNLMVLPLASAALSRMPMAVESLAVLPVLMGLSFTIRSMGLAFHEVVLTYLDQPDVIPSLQQFARFLAIGTSSLLFTITATPLSHIWFSTVAGLSPPLTTLGENALWLVVFLPALTVMESWYQGLLVHSHMTRAVTKSVFVYLVVTTSVLLTGVVSGLSPGLYVSVSATFLGFLMQTIWLHRHSQPILDRLTVSRAQPEKTMPRTGP
ncbi:MAG: hypothetical protein GKS05_09810 [Nitrospirales bacterium]|nr:hypothetical protein [Nitrospirales bacterium]